MTIGIQQNRIWIGERRSYRHCTSAGVHLIVDELAPSAVLVHLAVGQADVRYEGPAALFVGQLSECALTVEQPVLALLASAAASAAW